jgi:Na+/H+ antiporter NhaD/arsenite permease-like protein
MLPLFASAAPLNDLTRTGYGLAALAVFAVAYLLVMSEEKLHLRKSKPVMVAAGLIWAIVGIAFARAGDTTTAATALRHALAEYAELFLFVLVAMTFVNTLEERQVFDALRGWLLRRRLTLRSVFWATGLMAFILSSMLDNLTTALVMGTVAITVGRGHPKFVALACINVVVAANAGGAFSPFGDITTLMVWQSGKAEFWDFFRLFVPSLVNWLVPALLMSFAVSTERPEVDHSSVSVRPGGYAVIGIFAATIVMAVLFYNLLGLPPVIGMTTGLGLLQLFAYGLRRFSAPPEALPTPRLAPPEALDEAEEVLLMRARRFTAGAHLGPADVTVAGARMAPAAAHRTEAAVAVMEPDLESAYPAYPAALADVGLPAPSAEQQKASGAFDIFDILRRAEWDTLMFFYGIILCVAGLAQLGYLALVSGFLYGGFGPLVANVGIGMISSVIDNIPVMYAVLTMGPPMDLSEWLLVTLCAGVGGSLLSIGSAAGVALMGQARGLYTFGSHLRWTWAIAIGYAASIAVHVLVNGL